THVVAVLMRSEYAEELPCMAEIAELLSHLDQARDHERRDAPAERGPLAGHELPRLAARGGVGEEPHEQEGDVLGRDLRREHGGERPLACRARAEGAEAEEEAPPLLRRPGRGDGGPIAVVERLVADARG